MIISYQFISTINPGFIGGSEWVIVGLAVLLLLGGKQAAEVVRSIGKGTKELKKAKDTVKKEFDSALSDEEAGKDG